LKTSGGILCTSLPSLSFPAFKISGWSGLNQNSCFAFSLQLQKFCRTYWKKIFSVLDGSKICDH
jgi:hypothetical protein